MFTLAARVKRHFPKRVRWAFPNSSYDGDYFYIDLSVFNQSLPYSRVRKTRCTLSGTNVRIIACMNKNGKCVGLNIFTTA